MIVTDISTITNKGTPQEKEVKGFYMDGYLADNLSHIPAYLKKEFDVVGIVSGTGLVGVGKSSCGIQVATFIAWLNAGGEMNFETGEIKTRPNKPIQFNLEENIVFSAEDLQERAVHLFKKYGKNQVIVADEGRQGLESARTMEVINKGMEDFFQECRQYGHVIIVILPNFFKLHEDYAVSRSLFLIDAFLGESFERGFFNFYNRVQKEWLYYLGKKKIGVTQKYTAARPNFWGKFTKWMPFPKKEYEEAKNQGLAKKIRTRREKNLLLQRDLLVWLLKNDYKIKDNEIMEKFNEIVDIEISERTLRLSRERINEIISRKRGY